MVVLTIFDTHRVRQIFKTALLYATKAEKNAKQMVGFLLKNNANVNAQDTQVTGMGAYLGI